MRCVKHRRIRINCCFLLNNNAPVQPTYISLSPDVPPAARQRGKFLSLSSMSITDSELKVAAILNGVEDTKVEDAQQAGFNRRATYWRFLFDQALITPEILNWNYNGSGTASDPYTVSWIESDPRNPLTMAPWTKAGITALAAIITLAAALTSSTYSGCIPQIIEDFQVSAEVAALGLSTYVLGFAVGPLLWAPLGELYGRQVILFITYGAFTAFNAGAAGAHNMQTLIIFRFLAGSFAASSMTNTGGVIADMYTATHRGIAMCFFAMMPFMGPVFGPIIGGFLGQSRGWRWVQGLVAIFSGMLWILATFFIPETYAPVLLRKRARKLSQMTGKAFRSATDAKAVGPLSAKTEFQKAITRPWMLISKEPIVLLLSIYMSILYGILYMLFGAMPIIYQEDRGWNQGQGGLAFLGVAVGEIIACLYYIAENARYTHRMAGGSGSVPPEDRLIPSMVGSVAVPIGLFWFAWTNYPSIHFMASISAGAPFGFGMVLIFISVKNYLVDSYTVIAASALASTVVMRSLFAAVFPLFTTYMYHGLGIQWASSLPAFLALACTPLPFIFFRWGKAIRQKCKYTKEAQELVLITESRGVS